MKSLLTLVGLKHHNPKRAAELQNGEIVTLRREPENKFDKNAIAVYAQDGTGSEPEDVKIGYVKATEAATLAIKLDATEVVGFDGTVVRNEGTYVELEIEEPELGPRFPPNSTGIEEMPDPIVK